MENKEEFLKDWLEGKISGEKLKSLRESGDETVKAYDELITRTAGMQVPEKISKEEAWQNLSSRLNQSAPPKGKVVALRTWTVVSIAASLTLFAVAFFMFRTTEVTTTLAETNVHTLPDGSTVTLNADSRLSYNRFGWSGDREVTLEGEGFFDVKKGNSFIVNTSQGAVTVLGTTFNVQARAQVYKVSCFTGKVRVSSGDKAVVLTSGLQTTTNNNILSDAEAFDAEKSTWRQGDYYFDAAPLHEVFDELERQFAVEITFTGDASRTYSGYFSNKNLEEALAMVLKPMALTYTLEENKKITIR